MFINNSWNTSEQVCNLIISAWLPWTLSFRFPRKVQNEHPREWNGKRKGWGKRERKNKNSTEIHKKNSRERMHVCVFHLRLIDAGGSGWCFLINCCHRHVKMATFYIILRGKKSNMRLWHIRLIRTWPAE